MSVKDALLFNTTGSNFQALQTDDTARIKGDLSLQKDDGTEVVGIDVSQGSVNVVGNITASVNISGSVGSTGSFGRVVATTFHGDGSALKGTLPRSVGILTSSAQIAAQISGAFTAGFEFSSSISGSATSTGSFGRVEGVEFFGDGSNIKTTLPRSTGILTSSKQIASNISGSFNKGFNLTRVVLTSSFYTGVSGSTFHVSGANSSSQFGSDFTHILQELNEKSGLKGKITNGVWSTGGSMIQGKYEHGGFGDQNFSFAFGGRHTPSFPSSMTCNEEYNGSTWTAAGALTQATAYNRGVGTGFAGISFGGTTSNDEWNGLSWSETEAAPTSTGNGGASGTQNAANAMGANVPSEVGLLQYNGTNFSEGPTMSVHNSKYHFGGLGTQDATIIMGGIPDPQNCTEHFNGTSWFAGGALNTGRRAMNGGAGGENHAMIAGGMTPGTQNKTEYYDGTTWSEGNNLPSSVRSNHTNGTQGLGLSFGGFPGVGTTYESVGESNTSASFGRLEFTKISGDGTNLRSSLPYSPGLLSSSAQIASNISGSFNKGFEFSGEISGSIESTGSFGRLEGGVLRGDATGITGSRPYNGVVSSSAQIASNISGSFNKGFTFTGAIKGEDATWSQTACLIQERWCLGGVGSVNAAIAVGGQCGPHTHHNTPYALTEEYDGTSFTEVNDMIDASVGSAAGQYNDAYFHKQYNGNDTENWNGTNWSAGHVNPTSANQFIGGSTPSELYVIGMLSNCGNTFTDYNVTGGTFAVCTAVPFTFGYAAGAFGHSGDMTAGIVSSGWTNPANPAKEAETVIWNGSTWSDAASQLIPYPARAGWSSHKQAGTVNASFMVGGRSSPPTGPSYQAADSVHVVNAFQNWDGTSWSVKADIPQVHYDHAAVGTPQAALFFGGLADTTPGGTRHIRSGSFNYQEDLTTGSFGRLEFISASGDATALQSSITYVTNPSFNVLTGSGQIASQISGSFTSGFDYSGLMGKARGGVFASSTNLLDQHTGGNGGSMLQGTAIVAGGSYGAIWPPSTTDNTQVYDGTSWTEVNNLTSGVRPNDTLGLAGDSSAALFFGGPVGPGATEEWNGTNWSEVADIPDNASSGAGAGGESSESAIWVNYFGGRGNKWDGTAWSEINNLNFPRYDANSTGTRDQHFVVGGSSAVGAPTYPYNLCSEVFNGTNWTAVADVITPLIQAFGMGTYNDAIFAGGCDAGHLACDFSQTFDGTSWAAGPNIVDRRRAESAGSKYSGPAAGGATNAAWFGGGSPGYPVYNSNKTEVFPGFVVSASFGRLEAGKILGDATGIQSSLPYPAGIVSSSAQLASNISGSFNKGFQFRGEISGSVTSTGSFGRIEADFIFGDGSSISGSLKRNVGLVSGSAQIASNISGSFTSGFDYDGLIQTTPGGVWSAGGNLTRSTYLAAGGMSGAGTKSAALIVGGRGVQHTEEYDGSSFTEKNNTAGIKNQSKMVGTTESSVIYGGSTTHAVEGVVALTEEWNGTNWSEVNDLIQGRWRHGKLGISSNAAKAIGGSWAGTGGNTEVEDWNGTNWSAGTDLPAAMNHIMSAGTYDSGIVQSYATETYCWNGSSWSDVATLPDPQRNNRPGGFGTSNDALIAGGQAPTTQYLACVNLFDGSTWSSGPDMPAGRNNVASVDSANTGTSAGMIVGGVHGTAPNYCNGSLTYSNNITSASFHNIEVTNLTGDGTQFSASLQTQLLTSVTQISNSISGSFNKGFDLQGGVSASFGLFGDAWSIGGAVIDRSRHLTGFGTVDAAIKAGGANVNTTQATLNEEWNGALWSEIADMPAARKGGAGAGSANAGLYAGGDDSGYGGYSECSEVYIWNGISWVETLDLPNGTDNALGHGFTQDSALVTHGAPQYASNNADEWDGTTWTEKTANISSRGCGQGGGGTNAAHIVGGLLSSPFAATTTKTECWNGSAWSEESNTTTAHFLGFYAGITNDAHVGLTWGPPNIVDKSTEIYNGISWAVTAPVISATGDSAASGRTGVGTSQGGTHRFGGGVFGTPSSELFNSSVSTGSFELLRGTVGGEIKTDMFMVSGSTMKLPMFSDDDLNYHSQEPEEGTGSMSGSVVRTGDVNVLEKPGNFFFHTDYNALAFTYVSSSVYSQSVDFVRCSYQSGSVYTASTGFISQSHYCYTNVIQYITGSYT